MTVIVSATGVADKQLAQIEHGYGVGRFAAPRFFLSPRTRVPVGAAAADLPGPGG
ncbi:hypothetical protein [Ramlibacter sp.]|uniref:hypothetical protein n=1 Tax=Ramlibacter sp. TaxID=1917967 RepID=UPI00261A8422|nr:hypothetical protein [Ramlibacter sp.]